MALGRAWPQLFIADDQGALALSDQAARPSVCRWAYAKLGVTPPESFMAAAAQQMQHDLSRSVPQDISNTLWVGFLLHPLSTPLVEAAFSWRQRSRF